jgi:hypothetical protein
LLLLCVSAEPIIGLVAVEFITSISKRWTELFLHTEKYYEVNLYHVVVLQRSL